MKDSPFKLKVINKKDLPNNVTIEPLTIEEIEKEGLMAQPILVIK